MIVHAYTIVRNEEFMMRYFLRHYSTFCEKIYVIDDGSTDGTRKIVESCDKALYILMETGGLDDEYMAAIYSKAPHRISQGKADWVICVDVDEFIYGDLPKDNTKAVLVPEGWQMISENLPVLDGQIYDEIKEGVKDSMLNKPCIWNPELEIKFKHGRHWYDPISESGYLVQVPTVKLLHYRFMSRKYVIDRHNRNWKRMSALNKTIGSGIHNKPDWEGYQSMKWYEEALRRKTPCLS